MREKRRNFQFVSDYSFFPPDIPTKKGVSNRLFQQEFFLVACCVESSFIIRECFPPLPSEIYFPRRTFDKENINARWG
jgi:hypothetical protein